MHENKFMFDHEVQIETVLDFSGLLHPIRQITAVFYGQIGDFTSIPITNFPSPNSIWWPGILILQFQYIPLYIYI